MRSQTIAYPLGRAEMEYGLENTLKVLISTDAEYNEERFHPKTDSIPTTRQIISEKVDNQKTLDQECKRQSEPGGRYWDSKEKMRFDFNKHNNDLMWNILNLKFVLRFTRITFLKD